VSEIADQINALSAEFDARCQERHEMGEQKYGAGTWLKIDTLEMAIEELIDLENYVRFTYVKMRLLQESLAKQATDIADKSTAKPIPGNEMMGKDAMTKGVGLP
jgi:hypothetical protein